ncbi:Fe-S cluster assembly protein SufD [Bradyrhizobium sp.]|uniref:Fe-S cluster assembly protein SufD n=1 Tax=Bradyrhizobium sp. TaxID=376 RepID=UPI003C713B82
MNVVITKAEAGQTLSEAFARTRNRLPGTGKVPDARQRAFDSFLRRGLPHRRLEDWKYTDLRALMREVLPQAAAPDRAALDAAVRAMASHGIKGARRLVLVDGFFVPALSGLDDLEKGLEIRTLREVLESGTWTSRDRLIDVDDTKPMAVQDKSDPMIALNAAMMTDGVMIEVAPGTRLARPLQIVHIASQGQPAAMFTRSAVRVGKAATATLIESYIAANGAGNYQVHDATMMLVDADARLDHVRLVEDSRDAFNISSAAVGLGEKAHFNTFGLTTGAGVSRYQMFIECAGKGSQVETSGVNLVNSRQHADTTLFLDHAAPNCTSREIFRAVVDDRAHSVFQGRIIVRPKAQKTDAKMMTRALLLSDEAEADNKPELEIFADDVTCGHGATTGSLDESLLFYLRARGLSEQEAQALLIQAFVGEAIERIAEDGLRAHAAAAAERWLEARA